MRLILPMLFILLCLVVLVSQKRNLIKAIFEAWIATVLYTWMTTEILSIFKCWNNFSLVIAWGLIDIVLTVLCINRGYFIEVLSKVKRLRSIRLECIKLTVFSSVFLILISCIAILRSITNADNLNHRFSKIFHWIQQGNVGYFATNETRQVGYSTLCEYMNAQVYMLSGMDRLMNLVQIVAYIVSGLVIYRISRKLGSSKFTSIIAADIYWLSSQVIIEVTTAQTDVCSAVFLLGFTMYIMDYVRLDEIEWNMGTIYEAVVLFLCVIFGYLTKPTVCFSMLLLAIWFLIERLFRKEKIATILKLASIGVAVMLIIYLPTAARDYKQKNDYGQYLRTVENQKEKHSKQEIKDKKTMQSVSLDSYDVKTVKYVFKNPKHFVLYAIENITADVSSRSLAPINDRLANIIKKMEDSFQLESQPYKTVVTGYVAGTDEPNPVFIVIWIMGIPLVVGALFKKKYFECRYLTVAWLGVFVTAGLIGYTYYRQRYMIGALSIIIPIVAYLLETVLSEVGTNMVLSTLITLSVLGTVNNVACELPRVQDGFKGDAIHEYMLQIPMIEENFRNMISYVNNNEYHTVGMIHRMPYEMVLWKSIRNLERLEYIDIEADNLKCYEDMSYIPDCLIMIRGEETGETYSVGDVYVCHGVEYVCDYCEFECEAYYTVWSKSV